MKHILCVMREGRDLIVSTFSYDGSIEIDDPMDGLHDLIAFHFTEKVDFDDPQRFGLIVEKDFFNTDNYGKFGIIEIIPLNKDDGIDSKR